MPDRQFTPDEIRRHDELKKQGLERILGPCLLVNHSIVPFNVGGMVDMHLYQDALPGTALATMELIEPDGSGPMPSRIGTFELVACTRHTVPANHLWAVYTYETAQEAGAPFPIIERRLCIIFTALGHYTREEAYGPRETCELPMGAGKEIACLVLDEYVKPGVEFRIGERKHGLLLVIEVHRSEMEFAMKNGTRTLLERLKAKGHYPYSDLDREPVA